MDKVEIHRNQVYRLDRRRGALRKLPLLVRRLLHRSH
jgi:hypothetical protein